MSTRPSEAIIEGLVPIMPYPRCPHCGSMQILDNRTYGYYKGSITCSDCKGNYHAEFGDVLTAEGLFDSGPKVGGQLLSAPRLLGDPELLKDLTIPSIPRPLYNDYVEAVRCLAVDVPRAAAVMCRVTIQEALLLKGIPDDKPEKMVNIARSKQILSEMCHRQCLAAVFMCGKGAHPQSHWTEQVGSNEAKEALLITRRVLLELFPQQKVPVQQFDSGRSG